MPTIRFLSFIIPFAITLTAQAQPDQNVWIKKGSHWGGFSFAYTPFVGSSMERTVTFNDTNRYEFQGSAKEDQADINKLYGFTDCFSTHHQNSARFGWRWFQGKLELFGYTYVKGKRNFQSVGSVDLNRPAQLKIQVSGKKYQFYVNGQKRIEMERGCSLRVATGYKLFVYFGGNQVSPQDMYIRFNRFIF